MRLRRSAIIILAGAYLFAQLLTIIGLRTSTPIDTALTRYGSRAWPDDVCYPVPYDVDREGYTAAVYAIIPAVLRPYSPDCKDYLPR